jgi:hypothetical protein
MGTTLRYVEGGEPGFSRKRVGQNWHYFTANGKRVTSAATNAA